MFPENQEPFGSWERVFKEAGCSTPGGGKTNMCFELQASFTKLSMTKTRIPPPTRAFFA